MGDLRWRRVSLLGFALLLLLEAAQPALAPYHNPPSQAQTQAFELSLIHSLYHPGTTKFIAPDNKGAIFATATELKRGQIVIYNATTDSGERFHPSIAIVDEAGNRLSFDIVDPADPTKVLQASQTLFGLEQGKPVAIRLQRNAPGKLKVTHAPHGHPIELELEVK